jgi:predicted mannosyl-3-phosphoglycerate phosphatase (HAD superfamily)
LCTCTVEEKEVERGGHLNGRFEAHEWRFDSEGFKYVMGQRELAFERKTNGKGKAADAKKKPLQTNTCTMTSAVKTTTMKATRSQKRTPLKTKIEKNQGN